MKKSLSILLIFTLIFSLCACSGKDDGETTTAPPPVIEENTQHKEFKDSNGRVVFAVDVAYPQISENCDEKVRNYINKLSFNIFEEACSFAQSNIENAARFMDNQKSEKPWTKKITFQTAYSDSRYVCFIIKDALSYFGTETDPVQKAICFDMKTGEIRNAASFSTNPDDPAESERFLIEGHIIPTLKEKYYPPAYLTDEVLEALPEFFDVDNFYFTEDGIAFFFMKNNINPILEGIYTCKYTWDEISYLYSLPEE